jgi:hypothetical protein
MRTLTLPVHKTLIANLEDTQENFQTLIQASTGKTAPLKIPAGLVQTMKKFPAVVKWFAQNRVAYNEALTELAGDTKTRGAGG